MASQKTEWGNLSEVQLKGALVRRGLDTTGNKEELIKRLQDHEEGKLAENEEPEKVVDEDVDPFLDRKKLYFGYYVSVCLKTVIISPFNLSMLANEELLALLDQGSSYQIKKNKNGESGVVVKYPSAIQGDAAFVQIRNLVTDETVKVFHPEKDKLLTGTDSYFEDIVPDERTAGALISRCVVLENLPESMNNEDKLHQLFPEAAHVVSYQHEPWSKGIAILDFASDKEAGEFLTNCGEELEIENEKISAYKYQARSEIYFKLSKLRSSFKPEKELEAMSDEDRISRTSELKVLEDELQALQNSVEVQGQEKICKFSELNQKFNDESEQYRADTQRRIKAGEKKLPEGEDMLDYTKRAIQQKERGDTFHERNREKRRTDASSKTTESRGTGRPARGRGRGSTNGRTSTTNSRTNTPGRTGSNYGNKRSGSQVDSGPPRKRFTSSRGRGGGRIYPESLIEGFTSVITEKMRKLEDIQQQTLKTQAEIMKGTSGGMSSSYDGYRHRYSGSSSSGLGSSSYGGSSGSSGYYNNSSGSYGSSSGNYGSSSGNYGSTSGYGTGSSSMYSMSGGGGGSGSYYASPPSNKKGGMRGGGKKSAGRFRKR